MSNKVAVHLKLTAAPGKGDELVEAFSSLYSGPLDAEQGTELHVIHQAKDEPDTVVFYEVYTDEAAFTAHGSGAALKAIYPKLAGLVEGRPDMTVLRPRNAKGLSL